MTPSIASSAIVYPGVVIGDGSIIEDFCVIGAPEKGRAPGEVKTLIGPGAVIRSHTVIYAGNEIGARFQSGNKANIREHNIIGNDVSVGTMSVIEHHIRMASGVRVHSNVFIPEYCVLEEKVWVGPNAVLTNARYPAAKNTKSDLKGVTLKKMCRIGANATLLPGVVVGERALVGGGAVVTRNVEPGHVVYGSPATTKGHIRDIADYA